MEVWGQSWVSLVRVGQLPCACCPSGPGQSGPLGPTNDGRLPWSLALGRTPGSIGGHRGVARELQGQDLSGQGVAPLLQKWDPEPHPGVLFPGTKQHRSGREGGRFSARLASLCRGDQQTPTRGLDPELLGHTWYNVISRASRIARKSSVTQDVWFPMGNFHTTLVASSAQRIGSLGPWAGPRTSVGLCFLICKAGSCYQPLG